MQTNAKSLRSPPRSSSLAKWLAPAGALTLLHAAMHGTISLVGVAFNLTDDQVTAIRALMA